MNISQKIAIALFSVITATSPVFAKAIDTADRAIEVKEKLENLVFNIEGINGIGVSGCNPRTGAHQISGSFVHCVSISAETRKGYNTAIQLFPRGKKIDGVFITVEYTGPISPQPRVTGGN